MSDLPLESVGLQDASTLTSNIQTAVEQVTQSQGRDTATEEVISACNALVQAEKKLRQAPSGSYNARRAIDVASDHNGNGIVSTIQERIRIYSNALAELTETQKRELEAARMLNKEMFPDGMAFTQGRWYSQYGYTMRILAQAKQPAFAEAIQLLGLREPFALWERHQVEYGKRMGYTSDGNSPANLFENWDEALEIYVATVISKHKRNSPWRKTLLEPYHRLESELQELRRRQRQRAEPNPEPNPTTEPTPTPEPI